MPIWYQYAPGGDAWVLTGLHSRKAKLIAEAGRFSLMVEQMTPNPRYVSVEGPVVCTAPGTDEMLIEISARYLPPHIVDKYREMARAQHGEQIAIYMRPEHWLAADLLSV